MRSIALFVIVLALFGSTFADYENCIVPANTSFFNICPFTKLDPSVVKDDILKESITFSLGNNHVKSCGTNKTDIWGTYTDVLGKCYDVSKDGPSYTYNASDAPSGLLVTFAAEQLNVTGMKDIQIQVQLKCDMTLTNATTTSTSFVWSKTTVGQNKTIYLITGTSRYGCPVVTIPLDQLIEFLSNNAVIFAITFGLIGIGLTFLGLKLINIAIFIIATTTGTILTGTIIFQFTTLGASQAQLWGLFIVSFLVGLLLGYLSLRYKKAAYFFIGCALGFVGSLVFYAAVVSPFIQASHGAAPLYITMAICVLIGGTLALVMLENILIIATAVIGSYMTIRALSVFIGGFPPENYVAQGLREFNYATYGYLAAIIILAGLGIYVQVRFKPKEEDIENHHPKNGGQVTYYYR